MLGRGAGNRIVRFQVDPFDGGLVVGHVGGAAADILVSEGALVPIDWTWRELRKLLGSRVEGGFRRARVMQWASDPWARGCFAAARLGSARMRQVLGLPLGGQIYFAGEALHPIWAGQLAGAYLSGHSAAKQIIRDFGLIILS